MFITFEGIEGSGKTSQIVKTAEFLRGMGYDCFITREPGGTKIGEKIRGILLDPDNRGLSPSAELLLYMADRVQHVKEIIEPLLLEGKTVLCDRFFDATLVYQGYARGLDIDLINSLHNLILKGLRPDITILLDLPVKTGLKRAWKEIDRGTRESVETRFEEEALAFHEKVRSGYLELARFEPDRFYTIDSGLSVAGVFEDIKKSLCRALNSLNGKIC